MFSIKFFVSLSIPIFVFRIAFNVCGRRYYHIRIPFRRSLSNRFSRNMCVRSRNEEDTDFDDGDITMVRTQYYYHLNLCL